MGCGDAKYCSDSFGFGDSAGDAGSEGFGDFKGVVACANLDAAGREPAHKLLARPLLGEEPGPHEPVRVPTGWFCASAVGGQRCQVPRFWADGGRNPPAEAAFQSVLLRLGAPWRWAERPPEFAGSPPARG